MPKYPNDLSQEQYIASVVEIESPKLKRLTQEYLLAITTIVVNKISKKIDDVGAAPEAIRAKILELRRLLSRDSIPSDELGNISIIYGDLYNYKMGAQCSARRAIAAFNEDRDEPLIYPTEKHEEELLMLQRCILNKCSEEIFSASELEAARDRPAAAAAVVVVAAAAAAAAAAAGFHPGICGGGAQHPERASPAHPAAASLVAQQSEAEEARGIL